MSARGAAQPLPPLPRDHAALVVAAALAAFALGYALELGNGYYTVAAGRCLVFAFVAPTLALLLPKGEKLHAACARHLCTLLGAGLVAQTSLLTAFAPAKYLQLQQLSELWPMHLGVVTLVALALAAPGAAPLERWRHPAMAVASLTMGAWLVAYSPAPHVDVFEYARAAPAALLRGLNPYAMRFADVYGEGQNAYAAGLSDGKQTLVGFPYLPINLLVLSLGKVFADPRTTLHLLTLLAAGLVAHFGPCRQRARLAACCLLLTPRCLMLLEQSFLEPLAIALVAATAVSADRRPGWTPYLLGALLVTKQPMPLLAAAAWVLPQANAAPRARLAFAGRTLLAGTALTLPCVLWSPQAFWRSAVWTHFVQVRRPDSLTLATYVAEVGRGAPVPLVVCLALLAAVSALVVLRAPRTAASFATCFGLCYLGFLLFARQAYANYHHQVLASFFIGVGLADFGPRKVQR